MTDADRITTGMVQRALFELRGDREPVREEAIAAYLQTDVPLVVSRLRDLKRERVVKDVRRKGERLWTTW